MLLKSLGIVLALLTLEIFVAEWMSGGSQHVKPGGNSKTCGSFHRNNQPGIPRCLMCFSYSKIFEEKAKVRNSAQLSEEVWLSKVLHEFLSEEN